MKTCQIRVLHRAMPALARARRAGTAVLVGVALALGGCGGGDDNEAGTPLVPVTPSSASSAGAASAPADAQR